MFTHPITAAVIAALATGCADDHAHDTASPIDLGSVLLVHGRTQLEICVEVDAALGDPAESLARLAHDLKSLETTHPDWKLAGLDRADARITVGCPGGPLAAKPIASKSTAHVVGGVTTAPSPYRIYLHILGATKAAAVLGTRTSARAIAELVRVGDHNVAEVSTLLVVRSSALGTTHMIDTGLPDAIGLRSLAELNEPND